MADHKIKLTVVTPVKAFYEGYVSAVTLPSLDGEIGIMAGHSPLVFALKPGTAHIRIDNETTHFVLSEGYAEINANMALVVCDSAEYAETIDVRRAIESYKEAKENVNKKDDNNLIASSDSRSSGYVEDSVKALARAKARIHFIECYGSESQKEKLSNLKLSIE